MKTLPQPPQAWGLLTAIVALHALAFGLMVAWS